MKAAIGIDLGGTKLAGALVDETGRIVARHVVPTESERGADSVVARIVELTRALEAEAKKAGTTSLGIGVGAPGPLDPRTGVVYAMPNLGASWTRYPLKGRLEESLKGRVHVENDANAAMQGEAWCGAASGARDAVLLTLGTGVGGGIVAAGKLVRGARGVGAELGHLVVKEPDGAPCGCGGRGCLEQYASGTAIGRLASEAVAREPRGALAKLGRSPDAHAVLAEAAKGDALARSVIETAGRALGVGLTTIVHSLNPEVIVIGGGFGTASFNVIMPIAEKELRGRSFQASLEGLSIVPAKLGNDAGTVGAARSVLLGSLDF